MSLLLFHVARRAAAAPTRAAIAADRGRLAALEAAAAALLDWDRGLISGVALQDVVRDHRAALTTVDRGITECWSDEPGDPVAGVDYLIPADADAEDLDRGWTEPVVTGGRHLGYDPTSVNRDQVLANLAGMRAAA